MVHWVEFGCGTGFNTVVLSAKADSLVATDFFTGHAGGDEETDQIVQRNPFGLKTANISPFAAGASIPLHEPSNSLHRALKALAEMHRILKTGGTLIIANLDPGALKPFDRLRCWVRIIFNGLARFRVKPPKGFGQHLFSEEHLCTHLRCAGSNTLSRETIRDGARSSTSRSIM